MNEPTSQLSDKELMQKAQTKEPHRFGDLIRRYRRLLLRVAESRLGSRTLAEDVVQETFLSAFKSRHTYNSHYSFRTWLWTILLNQCKSAWGRKQRSLETSLDLQETDEGVSFHRDGNRNENQSTSPEFNLLAKERRELLDELLASLNADQSDALRLRFLGD